MMMFPDHKVVDTVHVISLDRTPYRYDLFKTFNPHLKLARVSACEGATLNKEDCIRQGVFGANLAYSVGAMGSAISHMRLWREALDHHEIRHIAEDDAIIRRDFQTVFHALQKERPDWDIILWSYNDDWPVGLVSTFGRIAALKEHEISPDFISRNYVQFQSETRKPALLPLASAAGIGFYSISPTGARKMLESCLPLEGKPARYAADISREWRNAALDVEMSRHYQTMEAYVSYPPLAIMINDSVNSTIRGAEAVSAR